MINILLKFRTYNMNNFLFTLAILQILTTMAQAQTIGAGGKFWNYKSGIKIDGLTKKFGELTAVDGLSVEIYENEIFGLLGPNGAGKTTTINMLCGLLQATL